MSLSSNANATSNGRTLGKGFSFHNTLDYVTMSKEGSIRFTVDYLDSGISNSSSGIDDEVNSILSEVYILVAMGKDRHAIDVVYDYFTRQFYFDLERHCDRFLSLADVGRLNSTLMVAILSITIPAKHKLFFRAAFFNQVRDSILAARGPEKTARLLDKYR